MIHGFTEWANGGIDVFSESLWRHSSWLRPIRWLQFSFTSLAFLLEVVVAMEVELVNIPLTNYKTQELLRSIDGSLSLLLKTTNSNFLWSKNKKKTPTQKIYWEIGWEVTQVIEESLYSTFQRTQWQPSSAGNAGDVGGRPRMTIEGPS